MSKLLYDTSMVCLAVLILTGGICMWRIIVGPKAADRAIALDTLAMVFIGAICVLCVAWNSIVYFDAVWILTLVGFLGSAAIARYIERGRVF
jgi:multisubunit Na+/H+ antiporter MnhF subunit